jgi:hypothetical protein
MQMFIPLAKIDEERRLVIGRAAQETPDRSGEILDYASAKPAFQRWSDEIQRASGGLSKGNLRVMHNPKVVAGKLVDLSFNDDERAIDVIAKVVDDNEWKKVVEGVYTGFSVGGSYGPKWKDEATGLKRYTPVVTELSLVDNPCIPTARIAELHKADGSVQELQLRGRVRDFAEILAARPRDFAAAFDARLAKAAAAPRDFDAIWRARGAGR